MFKDEVRTHRLSRGLSQERLAELSGAGLRTIRSIETGKVARPRPSTVVLLADALGLHGAERDRFHRAALLDDREVVEDAFRHPFAPCPRQLPAPPPMFTGRDGELGVFDQLHQESTVVITAIDGMAGIGKTALAVHGAHRIADRYPDGQLFIDLHGFTHGVTPIEPAEALDQLLRALGVPGPQIPERAEERAALYRSRLADQRVLIVLDNAATEAQVVPLLPGGSSCLVLITSRRRLAGLDHTHTLSLDTMPPPEAVTLFRQSAGAGRLTGQPPEVLAELVELCGRLPLAIRIAAARLRSHPAWTLPDLLRRLRDQQHRLVELAAGQRSITAALDLSYQHLSADQQRTYRLLGLHPGPDIDAYAAAALLDSTPPEAGRMLERLLEAHLLQDPTPGRYRFHDLTRAHAAHTTTRDGTDAADSTAVDRLLDYYRHTASAAMDTAYPYERERRPRIPPAHTPCPALSDPAAALTWLDTELPNLLAAAKFATEHGRPAHVLHLSTIPYRHLLTRGRYDDAFTLHYQALTTARATGQHAAEQEALTGLGDVHRQHCRLEQAAGHYQHALRLSCATGHRIGEIYALTGLGRVRWHQSRYEQATAHFGQALQIARATGHRPGELEAVTGLGHVQRMRGRYDQATAHFGQALQIAYATGHRVGELGALNGLGLVHQMQARYDQATAHFGQALQIASTTGHRISEYGALNGLGHVYRIQGKHEHAADHFGQLLHRAHDTGDRNFEFEARQGLGRLHYATGHPDAAISHHNRALALASELGQPVDQVRAHDGLAQARRALHQHERARGHWRRALDILTSLGIEHTDEVETTADTIRGNLAALAEPGLAAQPGTGETEVT